MAEFGSRVARRPLAYSGLGALSVLIIVITVIIAMQAAAGAAVAPVGLGTASSFGVLAGSTVTNTGASVINGDLGVSPGSAVTGFPPGIVNGTKHVTDGVASGAQSDLKTAYNDAAGRTPATSVAGFIGAGQAVDPGVYNATSSLHVGGALTLNAHGNPDAVFIFQVGSALITNSASHILLTNGAQACNVYWQVGSSATLGTNSAFQGNILALQSITVTTGDTITGRALARNGAVTLDDDVITVPGCTTPSPSPSPSTTSPSPSPTRTGPSPSPTRTGPSPSPTSTGPSPSPTSTGPSPSPSPTRPRPSPSPTTPRPAPTPKPVPTNTFPVTG
jgi:type VI secretion system secreted protein VgrG